MKHTFGICFTVAVVLAGGAPAWAQPARGATFGASGTVGVSRPIDSAVTDVYGTRLLPVTVQLDVRVAADVQLFGGFKWTRADGQTVVIGTPGFEESHATSLRILSYRFGAQASARVAARWTLGAGAGVCIATYRETWPDASLEESGRSTGFLALAEGRYRLNPEWSLLLRAEYTTLPAQASAGAIKANLGGVDGSVGLRFSF